MMRALELPSSAVPTPPPGSGERLGIESDRLCPGSATMKTLNSRVGRAAVTTTWRRQRVCLPAEGTEAPSLPFGALPCVSLIHLSLSHILYNKLVIGNKVPLF